MDDSQYLDPCRIWYVSIDSHLKTEKDHFKSRLNQVKNWNNLIRLEMHTVKNINIMWEQAQVCSYNYLQR